jgi:uncharacterized membrane protein YeaQ/YmgE (transglycosylase-associated protein family)
MIASSHLTIGKILEYLIAGLVIGVLARLILPGKQHMSIVATIVLGIVAAVIGGLIWNAIFPSNDGIAWIGSLIVAVVLLALYNRVMVSRRTGPTRRTLRP